MNSNEQPKTSVGSQLPNGAFRHYLLIPEGLEGAELSEYLTRYYAWNPESKLKITPDLPQEGSPEPVDPDELEEEYLLLQFNQKQHGNSPNNTQR